MADESEKKPGFVLNKKKAEENTPASTTPVASGAKPAAEKKRVVVVKKKTTVVPVQHHDTPHPVVKKSGADASADTVSVEQPNRQVVANEKAVEQKRSEEVSQAKTSSTLTSKSPVSFELNSRRPNVKAGNLSDHARTQRNNGGYRQGSGSGYQGRQGGYNNYNGGGYNRQGNNSSNGGYRPHREGGFTGAQAREGYQNRERDTRNGTGYQGRQGNNYRSNNNGTGYQGRQNGGTGFRPNGGGFQNRQNGTGFRPNGGTGRLSGFGSPAPVAPDRSAGKKQFKGKKPVYNRKEEEEFDEDKFFETKKKNDTPASVVPKQIDIMETISVSDLARKMNLKASDIIGKLMSMGMMVTINQSIDSDTATILASEYGCDVHLVSLYDETVIESEAVEDSKMLPRPPIVTVMGHVDHGKTKTLDAIRHTNVVAGEFGGITQHIGAYSVSTSKGTITFLDTPGHEAFTMMRARGAQITDIVVLVVAADDGVMPQTTEAINHAKDAKVPIIVAVNKIDKPEANPDRVRTQLSELGLTPEDWGGDTQYVNISALKGTGIDDLLDAILLQAEMLELKAPWDTRAEARIIETRVDQGRGIVASVVLQRGTLHTGDPFVAGIYSGRVRAMFNDRGQKITEATPSMPVEVLGLEAMPNAGDPFQVTENEKLARSISMKRQELKRFEDAKAVKKVTLDTLYETIDASEVKELKVVIKADLQGSAEALKVALEKLSTRDIRLVVIHSSAGAINESDVMLAAADSNAIIIGFNVRPTAKAKLLADQEKVDIRKYNIIYKAVEEVKQAMEGMLKPDTKEQVTGTVEVRNTFKVPKVGVIAGCYVTDGFIKRSSMVNLIRDGIVKFTGKVSSLKRFKDDAKEVREGFECGVGLENWQDIQVGDQIEAFEYIEIARKLGDTLIDERAEAEKKEAEREAAAKAEAAAVAEAEAEQLAQAKAAGKAKKARLAAGENAGKAE
ncbi:MAG: translation initiation factor IF-2 [Treponema sp.]|nr:translation initiation factor IF-2 [Treponema sp.]